MDGFPEMLAEIPDPPGLLYVRGDFVERDAMAVAIVGARHCTPYGLRIAEKLGASLARVGLTVVSGLARGIDAAAHRGALCAGGRTIAVLANGLAQIYPPEHEGLAREVAAAGAIVTESAMLQEPLAGLFPQRNRIISGLSLGVVIVEATPRSGSLATARHAMEQNREVFAVPGPVDSLASVGCHRLIRDGARLVETVDDILEELGPLVREVRTAPDEPAVRRPAELTLSDQERDDPRPPGRHAHDGRRPDRRDPADGLAGHGDAERAGDAPAGPAAARADVRAGLIVYSMRSIGVVRREFGNPHWRGRVTTWVRPEAPTEQAACRLSPRAEITACGPSRPVIQERPALAHKELRRNGSERSDDERRFFQASSPSRRPL